MVLPYKETFKGLPLPYQLSSRLLHQALRGISSLGSSVLGVLSHNYIPMPQTLINLALLFPAWNASLSLSFFMSRFDCIYNQNLAHFLYLCL